MEHIVTSSIICHADYHSILHPLQRGFRKGLSCETQLDDISRNLDKGKQTDCLIIDFSKAFDKVCHILLLHKLMENGAKKKTNGYKAFCKIEVSQLWSRVNLQVLYQWSKVSLRG